MRIAVIGSGISGLGAAWLLSREHEMVVFERNDYAGGHTHTHDIHLHGRDYRIDSGFIVCNPDHYPNFMRFLAELDVGTQETTMSFALSNQRSGLEYNATRLNTLFCQRRNLVSPRFWGMVRDILRFYREAPALLNASDPGPSIGDYLQQHRYSAAFRDDHLLPMASALWSSPSRAILDFPAKYLVQFMANHCMLQTDNRPPWRVIKNGSRSYVEAWQARCPASLRLSTAVHSIDRDEDSVRIRSDAGEERFDQVILACHSDQALSLLGDASSRERDILGALRFQDNDTVLHTDIRLLPRQRAAWAAWNALVFDDADGDTVCTVTYDMNQLQGIQSPETFCVSLNCSDRIDPSRILKRMHYRHPVYTQESVAARARRNEINGKNRTWFAGAYWGWGFHEDGMRSAVDVASALGVSWR